jgi:hypothetical protein
MLFQTLCSHCISFRGVYDVSPQPFCRARFAIGPVCRGRFAASCLISVFQGTNGNLISTIESKSTNPSGDCLKNIFSLSTNKKHELTFKPVIALNIYFAFSLLSIPYCSDSGNFLNFDFLMRR